VKHPNDLTNTPEKMIVSVYRTNITPQDLLLVKSSLDNFDKINKWCVDLEDRENILKIESYFSIEEEIIRRLQEHNFICIELH
jgi:hypothetical protein